MEIATTHREEAEQQAATVNAMLRLNREQQAAAGVGAIEQAAQVSVLTAELKDVEAHRDALIEQAAEAATEAQLEMDAWQNEMETQLQREEATRQHDVQQAVVLISQEKVNANSLVDLFNVQSTMVCLHVQLLAILFT